MPLQKVNRITTKEWPCALTALQCHLPSVPALVDVQCHLAGKTVVYSRKLMGKAGRKSWSENLKVIIQGTKQNIKGRECQRRVYVRKGSESEGWPACSSRINKDLALKMLFLAEVCSRCFSNGAVLTGLLEMQRTRTSDWIWDRHPLKASHQPRKMVIEG